MAPADGVSAAKVARRFQIDTCSARAKPPERDGASSSAQRRNSILALDAARHITDEIVAACSPDSMVKADMP